MLLKQAVNLPRGITTRVYRTRAGLWFPEYDHVVGRHRNVLAVLRRPDHGIIVPASNIVTDAGDLWYAQKSAEETPSPANTFGVHEMCTAGTPGKAANRSNFTPIASSEKAHASTYPKTNDGDADNTGAGTDIITYLASYLAADFNNAAISHGIITNVTPGASEPLLTGYAFAASFEKTASDTLKVFVNHQFNGT